MRESAKAKVNLFLHVGARRADGFHELESLAVFTEAGDALSFAPADALSLTIEGPFAAGLQGEPDNLVLRAARALAAHAGIEPRAKITLTKNLPVSSGIGGGSADAAAALRGLSRLWNLSLPREELHKIALSLGSDVPVCLESTSAWMAGRGEHVTPVSIPRISIMLVNPGVSVSTAEVFRRVKARSGIGAAKPAAIHSTAELISYLKTTTNDLEAPAREIAPVIGDTIAVLSESGALLAGMSGSGATCFGIYESDADAAKAADSIAKARAAWWVGATHLA